MVEPVVSRPARPRGWRVGAGPGARAIAASGTFGSGSGSVSFSHPPPRTFLFSTDMARQFRNCLAALIPKSKPWEKNLIGELGSHVHLLI